MNARIVVVFALLVTSVSFAGDGDKVDTQAIQKQLEAKVLAPMKVADKRRKRFPSREAPMPSARRVRVTRDVVAADGAQRRFVPFAIDNVYSRDDVEEAFKGCFYLDTQEAFVDYGDAEVYPAKILLGKMADATPDRCRPEPTVTARK